MPKSTALGLAVLAMLLLAGCGGEESGQVGSGPAQPGSEVVPTYDPDTLAWVQQGRTVHFDGREWLPYDAPVRERSVMPVGEFEGMRLYAPANESKPYQHLLFPIGNQEWQLLRPVGPVPRGDSTGTAGASTAAPVAGGPGTPGG